MSTSIGLDLDDYELRARAMQGMEAAYWPMPLAPILAPPGLSPLSSLGVAEKETPTPQHRPSLPEPTNIMHALIDMHNMTEELNAKGARNFKADVAISMANLKKLELEKQEELEKAAHATSSASTWSTLATVAQYIAGAGGIALGWAIGGLPGLCIGIAGGAALTPQIIRDTKIMNWFTQSAELQNTITQYIETTAIVVQLGLGLAGGVMAWKAGAFAATTALSTAKQTASAIETASGVLGGAATVGAQYHKKQLSDTYARMKEIDCGISTESQDITQKHGQVNRALDNSELEVQVIRDAIRKLAVSPE